MISHTMVLLTFKKLLLVKFWRSIKWNGILLSSKKERTIELLMYATVRINFKDFILSERGQFQKVRYCIIPFK